MTAVDNGTRRPYAEAALLYFRAGWSPIPVRGKFPPVSGFTGKDGADPSFADISTWSENGYGSWNIAVRLPDDVIGIDEDHYDGKQGAATIAACEARWGALPPTAWSTSRADGSRIRLYRVPPGLSWPGDLGTGSGVEIIRHGHRYAVVWPSVHPTTGATYGWHVAAGELDGIPPIGTLGDLPTAWVVGITGGQAGAPASGEKVTGASSGTPPPRATDQGHGGKHAGRIPYGSRHIALVSYAGSLLRRGLRLDEAEVLMLRRLRDCDQPPTAPTPVTEAEALAKLHDVFARYPAGEVPPEGEGAPGTEETPEQESTWARVDLSPYLDGTFSPPVASLFSRTDGVGLLYPGLTHSFHGESESGKSLIVQAEVARLITAGESVLFIDFESDAGSVTARLRDFGADTEAIRERLVYVRPEVDPRKFSHDYAHWQHHLSRRYALAVLDGVTDGLTVFGYETRDNDGIAKWMRAVPRTIARRTGAAVVLVDHVTKDAGSRGRFAIGGQAKLAGLDGAAYVVEVAEVLGRGLRGVVTLRVAKDRPGSIRPHCGGFRKTDRTQEAARVVVDSTDGIRVVVAVQPHRPAGRSGEKSKATFRPTALMEKVSKLVEFNPGLSKNSIAMRVEGNKAAALTAVDMLVDEGFLARTTGARGAQTHSTIRSYRQVTDPLSDRFQ